MAHPQQIEFCLSVKNRLPQFFSNRLVIDIGSLDLNGNNQYLFDDCLYFGIDLLPGKNVDLAVKGHELNLPDASVDVIVSTECFEHDQFYSLTLNNIVRMLKPGGLFVFSCATTGRAEHGTRRTTPADAPFIQADDEWGDYYKNLEEHDIRSVLDIEAIFEQYEFSINLENFDLYFWGIKKGVLVEREDYSFQIKRSIRDMQIAALNQAVSERDDWLINLNQTVAERDGQIANLNQAVTEHDGQITDLNQAIAERDGQIAIFKQAITERDGQITHLRMELEGVYQSRSWRISKPLRLLSTTLRRWFPSLMALQRCARVWLNGDKAAAGRFLALWWYQQKNDYETLRVRHPIWAKFRYGFFIQLADRTIKSYFKTKLGFYGLPFAAFGNGAAPTGEGSFSSSSIVPLPAYSAEYQADEDFSALSTDIKAIAFYLPQFHVIKENNEWWGEDFTEWSNTQQAEPNFLGHYQPREPHDDIGYYDLSDIEVIRQQADLARKHGIYGFCFYHYWFSGKRLLEKPVDFLLEHPEIDIHFCLCWANENWTRTWDGLHQNVLIEQKYLAEDAVSFIQDIQPYLEDPRYIRIDGKPVIMVYKAHIIPNVQEVFNTWRQWWRNHSGGELEIWCNRTNFADQACKDLSSVVDAVVEFPPHVVAYEIDQRSLGFDTTGHFYDYQSLVADIVQGTERTETPAFSFYRSAMLGWDNAARRKNGWSTWYGFSMYSYYRWLRHIISYTRNAFPIERRFVFINAWNEWAEGTYLEPDRKYGYASINTTSRALFDLPLEEASRVLTVGSFAQESFPGSIAVHIHVFFEDLAKEILEYVNHIPYPFDLYITTDAADKAEKIQELVQQYGCQKHLEVIQTPNIGRDVAPFLVTMGSKLSSYDYIGHFHTKKSTTVNWGDHWRRYLLNNLLGSREGIQAIFQEFEHKPRLGLLYPPAYPLISSYADWGGNENRCQTLLHGLGCDIDLPVTPKFPAGNMFWARSAAIKPIFEQCWQYEQFEPEKGQIVGTLPHAVERLWRYIVSGAGYHTEEILLKVVSPRVDVCEKRRLAFFAHYEPQAFISDADLFYLQELKKMVSDIIVISNNPLSVEQCNILRQYAKDIIQRPNLGFDFAAWRDGINTIGWPNLSSYDEVILANNSCYGPMFPFVEMFSVMESKVCDFWSVSSFPASANSSRAEAKLLPENNIPFHLQSYFMVFNKRVLASPEFKQFWERVEDKQDILDVVALYETQLTGQLTAAGFQADCYLPESYILQERNNANIEFNAVYNQPLEMLRLRSPLIKKKAADYGRDQIPLLRYMVANFGYFPTGLLFSKPHASGYRSAMEN